MKKRNIVGKLLDRTKQRVFKEAIIQKEKIDLAKLIKINILTSYADIEILIHDEPVIDIVLETYKDGPELMTNCSNGNVEIVAKKPDHRSSFTFHSPPCRLNIRLPMDVAESVIIQTSSGNVSATGLIADSIVLLSSSGNLNLTDLKSGKTTLNTSSGKIKLNGLKTDELQFETSSGNVVLETINGSIKGRTNSGNVNFAILQGENLEVSTSSGGIKLKDVSVAKSLFKTSSGNLKADYFTVGKVLATTSSGDMKFRHFSGDVKGDTQSGTVQLALVKDSKLDIRTGSGDIKIELDKEELHANVDISTKSGDIVTNLPMHVTRKSKGVFEGISGDGSNPIRLSTRSGDVVMYHASTSFKKM